MVDHDNGFLIEVLPREALSEAEGDGVAILILVRPDGAEGLLPVPQPHGLLSDADDEPRRVQMIRMT